MGKIKVPVFGTVGKAVFIEQGATLGATIGTDLRLPDGSVPSLNQLAAALGVGQSANSLNGNQATLWRFIGEKPANIIEVAALSTSGLVVRQASGDWITRAVAVQPRLVITNADGDSGNPTIDMADLAAVSVLGNSTAALAKPAAVTSSGDKAVLHQSGSTLSFSVVDSSYVSDFTEAAQDAVGLILGDTADILFTYDDVPAAITAELSSTVHDSLDLADSAVQPGDLAVVAFTGDYDDLTDKPTIPADTSGAPFITFSSSGLLSAERVLTAGTNITLDTTVAGLITINASGSGVTFANPTASVGLSAVNGVATTAMRSDAAPALDVGISPTWSGTHTFSNQIITKAGSTSSTAVAPTGDPNTGLQFPSADRCSLVGGGSELFTALLSGGVISLASRGAHSFQDGSLTIPGWNFDSDSNTGFMRSTSDQIDMVCGGVQRAALSSASLLVKSSQVLGQAGSASAPTFAFEGAANKGLYSTGVNAIGLSADGALQMQVYTNATEVRTRLELSGVISPGQLTATTNDWNPTGLSGASVIRVNTNAAGLDITGIAGGTAGRILVLVSVQNSFDLIAESASSSAANRILMISSLSVNNVTHCMLWYDGTASRWRVISAGTL